MQILFWLVILYYFAVFLHALNNKYRYCGSADEDEDETVAYETVAESDRTLSQQEMESPLLSDVGQARDERDDGERAGVVELTDVDAGIDVNHTLPSW